MAKVDTKARLVELNDAFQAKSAAYDELSDAVVIDGTNIEIKADQVTQARALLGEMGEIKQLIVDTELAAGLRDFAAAPATPSVAGRAQADLTQTVPVTAAQLKTLGEMFTSSEGYEKIKQYRNVPGYAVSIDVSGDEQKDDPASTFRDLRMLLTPHQKDVFTALGGSFSPYAFGTPQNTGIVQRQHRTKRVRDLFPSDTTSSNLIEYLRVTGFTNSAAPVRERNAADGVSAPVGDSTDVFGLKPSSDLTFSPQQAPVRTIAHNVRAHRNTLDDEPRLQAIINSELLYGLQLVEDAQILSGSGSGENVLGILNTSGIQTQTQANTGSVATEKKSKTLRKALTKVMLAYYEPTGIVLNPLDWEDVELEEDANGRYMLVSQVSVGLEQRLWRVPVVDTAAIAQNTALVGSFGLGARVWDRMQANVQVSTEDRDNFIRNAVTIQAEQRIALEVGRPESFVAVTMYGEPS